MKITELHIKHFGKIIEVFITPKDNVVKLTGKNAAGKSTIIDAIETVFAGKKIEMPIHRGKEKSEITIKTEVFNIKKVCTAKGVRLEVSTLDGEAQYAKPVELLGKLYNEVALDPSGFFLLGQTKPGKREQRDILMRLAGIDFAPIEQEKKETYDKRTLSNSRVEYFQGQLKGMEEPGRDLPLKEIPMAEGLKKMDEVAEKEKVFEEYLEERRSVDSDIEGGEASIEMQKEIILTDKEIIIQAEKRIEGAKGAIKLIKADIQGLRTIRGNLCPPCAEVTDAMRQEARAEIDNITDKNIKIREAVKFRELEEQKNEAQSVSDRLTAKIKKAEDKKNNLLSKAKFPLKELSVDDEGILYKGLPLSKLSQGEGILVASSIGMALNPTLEVLLIRNGSFLDSKGEKTIAEMAKKKGYQVWIERVADEADTVGLHFVEGAIVAVDGEKG